MKDKESARHFQCLALDYRRLRVLSLEAQGRRGEGFDRSLQKRVNRFAACDLVGRPDPTRMPRWRTGSSRRTRDLARHRAAGSAPAAPRAPGRCGTATTCDHCRRHSVKRGARRAQLVEAVREQRQPAARGGPAGQRLDDRALVERPVLRNRRRPGRSRARPASAASDERVADRLVELAARGDLAQRVVASIAVSFPCVPRRHQPASSQRPSSSRASALSAADARRPPGGARRRRRRISVASRPPARHDSPLMKTWRVVVEHAACADRGRAPRRATPAAGALEPGAGLRLAQRLAERARRARAAIGRDAARIAASAKRCSAAGCAPASRSPAGPGRRRADRAYVGRCLLAASSAASASRCSASAASADRVGRAKADRAR